MRRLLLALLFPLLLIAQQGAFVHGLEHLSAGAAAPADSSKARGDRHAPSEQYCAKCFAFAHIGAAADLPPAALTLQLSQFDAIGLRLAAALPALLRSPRSRGPPLPL
jgi:hypothetical protein